MSERRFDIVFAGKLVSGTELEQVKSKVAGLFKLDDNALATLFSGERVIIKKGVDRPTAVKYQQAMTKAGAVIQLVLHNDGSEPAAAASSDAPVQSRPAENQANAGSLSIAPVGSDLLTHTERAEIPEADIDTSHLQTEGANDNPFLSDDNDVAAPAPESSEPSYPTPSVSADTGDLQLGELGAGNARPADSAGEQISVDVSHLSAAEADAELLTEEERAALLNNDAPMIELDLDLTLGDVGDDLLEDSEKTPTVTADIDTSQLSIAEVEETAQS